MDSVLKLQSLFLLKLLLIFQNMQRSILEDIPLRKSITTERRKQT